MQGAWRCIVRLDQFCLAGGCHFCAMRPQLFRQRNGTFVPFGVQPSGCTDVEQLKPVLHARFGVQPSGCTDLEQAKACTPCVTVGYFMVVGMEFSLQAAPTLSRL